MTGVFGERRSPGRGPASRPSRAVTAWLGVVAALVLLLAGCTTSDTDEVVAPTLEVDTPRAEQLQAVLEQFVVDSEVVGMSAAVVTDAGAWAGAAGVDGAGDRLGPEAAMAISHVTKTVTAAEVLLLADQGLVGLDDPVTDYVDVPFDANGATVRQLLSMQSGFPDPTEEVIAEGLEDLDQEMTSADWYALAGQDDTRAGSLAGSQHFNNLNFVVLGDLIEVVAEQPYAVAVREDLLDQAGLERVWVQDDEQPVAPLAIGVDDPDQPVVDAAGRWLPSRSIASGAGAAAGIAADAATLATWGLKLYTGQVIESDLVDQMITPPPDGWYGLGTEVGNGPDAELIVGHGGGIGPYNSLLQVWPQERIAVAWLSPQRLSPLDDDLADQLHQTWTTS